MSADTERDRVPESEAVLDRFQRWYHVPALLGVVAYMLWIRTRAYDEFVTEDNVFFRGNDAYYHLRATTYSVENWPRRLYGDPYTYFPYGSNVGHFGTLFDQFWATVALIVGLGDPTAQQVAAIAVLAPAILGTLVAVPTYFFATKLSGSRLGGVTAAALLAVFPQGIWVTRTTVGFYDHHVAETFLIAVLGVAVLYALQVVERERPVYEQVQDRDWEGLKPSLRASAVLGVALGIFLLTWPSAIVFAGILAVFVLVWTALAVLRDESPEHVAFLGVVSALVATAVVLPFVQSLDPTVTTLSSLQLLFVPAVAAGCAFLAALARYWERQDLDRQGYPVAVGAVGVVGIGIAWLVLPDVMDLIWSNVQRILFLGQSDTTLTIEEAQSMDLENIGEQFYVGYGFAAFSALLALGWIGSRAVLAQRGRADLLFVTVLTVFLVLMSLTQQRFNYYLVVAVAVLNGWLVVQVVRLVEFPSITAPERFETHHVLTVLVILLVLFVPVLIGGVVDDVGTPTAADRAAAQQPGSVQLWEENTDWMAENTPRPGEFGDADDAMSYYGPYDSIDDYDYDYPEGAYGVMSWWDYGHWITVDGERPAMANPFQQGPRPASAFFQETDEERANLYLDALSAHERQGRGIENLDDEELRDLADQQADGEEIRYVVVDDQMAGGKFGAITEWAGPDESDYVDRRTQQIGEEEVEITSRNQRYDETMLSRLYFGDAGGLEHYRLVKEEPQQQPIASIAQQRGDGVYEPILIGADVQTMNQVLPQSILEAAQNPTDERYQLYDVRQASAVKTFERVEGATITGTTAAANQSVRATVPLETAADRETVYVQQTTADENGQFELTVPYATDDQLSVEDGYTEPDVVATDEYTVEVGEFGVTDEGSFGFQASERAEDVAVPEPAIYQGEEVQVDLEEVEDPENETEPIEDEQTTDEDEQTSDEDEQTVADGTQSDDAATGVDASDEEPAGAAAPVAGALLVAGLGHGG